MSRTWLPARGLVADVRGRLPLYKNDWLQGCNWGFKVVAPATYIFFASALPALAFGQQLAMDTDGTLTVVHVLISTALAGLVQSILGGQPLLIIGVAEPIVLIYGFMFSFCSSTPGLGPQLYLAWCGWVCVWTALMCVLLAVSNACDGINRFTRFSGELFGALIAILFLQVGIKGIVHEFQPTKAVTSPATAVDPSSSSSSSSSSSLLLLVNGLWGLFLAAGLLLSSLRVLTARSWLIGRAWCRGLMADYGVPLLVVVWSALSFAVAPDDDVPRRVLTPNTWEVNDNWSVVTRMSDVPNQYIAAALLPAAIIAVLFYFDHNVSSQMAQQPEFNLKKPAAYHYDFLLLAALTMICGLLGLPPVNGVLPQAPMHTRSLAQIKKHKHKQQQQQQQQQQGSRVAADALLEGKYETAAVVAAAAAADSSKFTVDGCSMTAAATTSVGGGDCQGSHTQNHENGHSAVPAAAAAKGLNRSFIGVGEFGDKQETAVQLSINTQALDECGSYQQLQQQQQQQRGIGEVRHRHTQHGHSDQQQQQQQLSLASAAADTHQQQQQQRGACLVLKEVGSEVQLNRLPDSAAAEGLLPGHDSSSSGAAGQSQHHGHYLQLEVREQRVTNLLQSLLLCVCLAITPVIKLIPTAVLWGYFIFMAVESLTGSQLWERTLLLLTDPKKRVSVMQQEHAAYLQLVPHRVVVYFTSVQLLYLLGVWALTTWAGIAGVAFPLPIMALVFVRQYLLPLLFKQQHLAQLDAASYEEAPAITDRARAQQELYAVGALADACTLPVVGPVAADASAAAVNDNEEISDGKEMLQQEFKGYQLKHHLTADELEQQRSL